MRAQTAKVKAQGQAKGQAQVPAQEVEQGRRALLVPQWSIQCGARVEVLRLLAAAAVVGPPGAAAHLPPWVV